MKGLLIKDFRLMKTQKSFFLVVVALGIIVLLFSDNGIFASGFMSFVFSLFSISTISYDEFDNGNAFLFSLPVSREIYSIEKYCFGFLLGVSAWAVTSLLALLSAIRKGQGSFQEMLAGSFILLPLMLVMLAVMIPIIFKFGGEKGRIVMILAYVVLFLAGSAAVDGAKALGIDVFYALEQLSTLGTWAFLAAALGAALLIMLVSVRISIGIIKKKEF